ncbi:MAG: metallophosphoesterase [Myxococcales bacterium]|nr:metallophosphoesterase [Myxococcales bacterium]
MAIERGLRSTDGTAQRAEWRHPRKPLLRHYSVPVRGLDPAHHGLRIAHLSDLHVGILTPHGFIRNAVEMIQAEKPDLVLMTGDFVCYSQRFVGPFRDLVSGFAVPTVCVLGNHDYWTDGHGVVDALSHHHYDVLRNQHTRLWLRHAPLTIVGIDDAATGQADATRAFRGVHEKDSRLILSHVPSQADRAATFGPGLIVSGHTHGGHIDIPKVTAHIFRRLGAHYLKGFYQVDDATLYVSCGVGSSSVPIRAGSPAEVAVLTLQAAERIDDDRQPQKID